MSENIRGRLLELAVAIDHISKELSELPIDRVHFDSAQTVTISSINLMHTCVETERMLFQDKKVT